MKKTILLMPLIFLGTSLLTGCSLKERVRLTYGSYIQDDLIALDDFFDLQKKMSGTERGENFFISYLFRRQFFVHAGIILKPS